MCILVLWFHDQSLSTDRTLHQAQAVLWRPEYSGVFEDAMAFCGIERMKAAGRVCWVNQRWWCEPMSLADLKANMEQDTVRWRWSNLPVIVRT
jgi:hypothetical protein